MKFRFFQGDNAQLERAVALAILIGTGAWYVFTKLVWGPVPWPDGSAFYLPSLELLNWPIRWRMHAQAAFVPTYDQANFNLMPALPIWLGVLSKFLGFNKLFGAPLAIKVASIPALLAWAWVLWRWGQEGLKNQVNRRIALVLATSIALAGLWDPVNRWGTLVVRTETWIGLAWVLLLREMDRITRGPARAESRALWKISAFLAMAAYFHFEAAYLIPAAIVGLFPVEKTSRGSEWTRRLLGVTWRTLIFLSPWLAYVFMHWGLFWEQMDVQFHRLGHSNSLIANPYLIFHSLFLSLGSPVFTPKVFNVAKGLFWGLILFLTFQTLWDLGQAFLKRRSARDCVVTAAAGLAFWTTFYLWCSKPEVWFTTLCHLTLWPWLAARCSAPFGIDTRHDREASKRWSPPFGLDARHDQDASGRAAPRPLVALGAVAAVYAVFSLGAGISQQVKTPDYYSWRVYKAWVDCIESSLGRSMGGKTARHLRIWQPHTPDVLVELSQRSPQFDLTRALDFESRRPLALEFGRKADLIIFSRFFNLSPGDPLYDADSSHVRSYEGPERPTDIEMMRDEVEVPFGPWALTALPTLEPGSYVSQVCQVGPFWADLRIRVR